MAVYVPEWPKIKFNGKDIKELADHAFKINCNYSTDSCPEVIIHHRALEIQEELDTPYVFVVIDGVKYKLIKVATYRENDGNET